MEIQALKLVVSEQGLNALLAEYLPADFTVENLNVRIQPEGLFITGAYPTVFVKVPFETHWEMKIVAGHVHARLVTIMVSGIPGSMFRKLVLDMIQEFLQSEPGVVLHEETLQIDVETLARAKKVSLQCHLRDVHFEAGKLLLVAGLE